MVIKKSVLVYLALLTTLSSFGEDFSVDLHRRGFDKSWINFFQGVQDDWIRVSGSKGFNFSTGISNENISSGLDLIITPAYVNRMIFNIISILNYPSLILPCYRGDGQRIPYKSPSFSPVIGETQRGFKIRLTGAGVIECVREFRL